MLNVPPAARWISVTSAAAAVRSPWTSRRDRRGRATPAHSMRPEPRSAEIPWSSQRLKQPGSATRASAADRGAASCRHPRRNSRQAFSATSVISFRFLPCRSDRRRRSSCSREPSSAMASRLCWPSARSMYPATIVSNATPWTDARAGRTSMSYLMFCPTLPAGSSRIGLSFFRTSLPSSASARWLWRPFSFPSLSAKRARSSPGSIGCILSGT